MLLLLLSLITLLVFATMVVVYTDDKMLHLGLSKVGCEKGQQQKLNRAAKLERFLSYYGSKPIVLALIWEELQTTNIVEACIDLGKTNITIFFMVMYFFKCYPVENIMLVTYKVLKRLLQEKIWTLICNIQALKSSKVSCKTIVSMFKVHLLTRYSLSYR